MFFCIFIWISAAFVAVLYFLFRFWLVRFSKNELERSDCTRTTSDAIEVFAQAESLEYYVRCALVAAEADGISVIVYIPRDHKDRQDMVDIAMRLHRSHKNLSYRFI